MLPYVSHKQKLKKHRFSKHIFDLDLHNQKKWGLIKSINLLNKAIIYMLKSNVYSLCLRIICLNAHKNVIAYI